MADPTLGDEHRLPFEKGGDSPPKSPVDSLFDALASDPEFSDEETPEDVNEPAADEAEPEEYDEDDFEGEGSEDDEAEDSEDEEPEELPHYRVTVAGEELEVTLDELIAGYSRQSDYTRKTQALAEERKAAEAEKAQIREARNQYAQRLEQLESVLEQQAPAQPDWDRLRQEDPAEFAAQWAEHQQRQADLQAVKAERERVTREQSAEYEAQLKAHLAAESEKLHRALGWEDDTKAAEHKRQLADYLTGPAWGFAPEELGQVVDHRVMVLAEKARRWDELQSSGREAIRQKSKAAKVLKPGGRQQAPPKSKRTAHKRAMEKLARTGRADDAAAAILSGMPDSFFE